MGNTTVTGTAAAALAAGGEGIIKINNRQAERIMMVGRPSRAAVAVATVGTEVAVGMRAAMESSEAGVAEVDIGATSLRNHAVAHLPPLPPPHKILLAPNVQ